MTTDGCTDHHSQGWGYGAQALAESWLALGLPPLSSRPILKHYHWLMMMLSPLYELWSRLCLATTLNAPRIAPVMTDLPSVFVKHFPVPACVLRSLACSFGSVAICSLVTSLVFFFPDLPGILTYGIQPSAARSHVCVSRKRREMEFHL